jgi:hypothetical protein
VVALRTGAAAVAVFPSVFDQGYLRCGYSPRVVRPWRYFRPMAVYCTSSSWPSRRPKNLTVPRLAALPPGLYLLRVVLNGQASLHRVVKQ